MAVKHTQELIYCSFCGKNQEEVKKIIAGNNVFICNECVELAQEIIREELAEEVLTDLADTPKPQELLNILNNYVIGQDRAKRALAVAVYNHYTRINFQDSRGVDSYVQGFLDAISADKNIILLGQFSYFNHSKIIHLAGLQEMLDQPLLKKRLWQFMQKK